MVVDISGNPVTGGRVRGGSYAGQVTVGDDITGISIFLEALQASTITSLSLSNCGLGPKHVAIVASTLSTAAGVETVDLSNNRFDPSLLDGIKHKVKLNLAGCRA